MGRGLLCRLAGMRGFGLGALWRHGGRMFWKGIGSKRFRACFTVVFCREELVAGRCLATADGGQFIGAAVTQDAVGFDGRGHGFAVMVWRHKGPGLPGAGGGSVVVAGGADFICRLCL